MDTELTFNTNIKSNIKQAYFKQKMSPELMVSCQNRSEKPIIILFSVGHSIVIVPLLVCVIIC